MSGASREEGPLGWEKAAPDQSGDGFPIPRPGPVSPRLEQERERAARPGRGADPAAGCPAQNSGPRAPPWLHLGPSASVLVLGREDGPRGSPNLGRRGGGGCPVGRILGEGPRVETRQRGPPGPGRSAASGTRSVAGPGVRRTAQRTRHPFHRPVVSFLPFLFFPPLLTTCSPDTRYLPLGAQRCTRQGGCGHWGQD